ncbi:MAG: hypothetical protein WD751_08220 [Anaerolineales bacterium]
MAANVHEAPLEDGVRALVFGLALAAILLWSARFATKDWHRAGLLASIILVGVWGYGHTYSILKTLGELGLLLARHRFLLPVWLALTLVLIWYAWKTAPVSTATSRTLNLVAIILLAFPLFSLSNFTIRGLLARETEAIDVQSSASEDAPDIYYILTDAYSRQDVLADFYDFDNSNFLGQLKDLGFYVADCSLSNYPKTRLSLTSSLNLNYMEELGITANDQLDVFFRRIRNNVVRKTLAAEGYMIVSLETGFYWTEWPDADVYFSGAAGGPGFWRLSGFEALLLQTTVARAVTDWQKQETESPYSGSVSGGTPQEHYNITSNALNALDGLGAVPGPKFVFAHLLIPHGPFVVDEQGNFTNEDRPLVEAHNAQLVYLNKRLIEILTNIIEEASGPVVIILQGDHGGPGTQQSIDRMKILNAYYWPGHQEQLYPSITPVNTFRLIFDTIFGTEYGLLEDLGYYSTSDDFFDVTLIEDDNPACISP